MTALVSRHRERKSSFNKTAAGLNGGQTKQNSRHKSQHRTELNTHINLAILIRHSLKYKNTVSQKTFYRDTKLQMSSKISKGGKEARLKEGGGGPETTPAHAQTRRAEDKHTDRQTSADNTALGFRAP